MLLTAAAVAHYAHEPIANRYDDAERAVRETTRIVAGLTHQKNVLQRGLELLQP